MPIGSLSALREQFDGWQAPAARAVLAALEEAWLPRRKGLFPALDEFQERAHQSLRRQQHERDEGYILEGHPTPSPLQQPLGVARCGCRRTPQESPKPASVAAPSCQPPACCSRKTPRSVSNSRLVPVERTFSTTFFISHGAKNCPFFTLIALPVLAAASTKSVCLQRNAGICSTSHTSATGAHCHVS